MMPSLRSLTAWSILFGLDLAKQGSGLGSRSTVSCIDMRLSALCMKVLVGHSPPRLIGTPFTLAFTFKVTKFIITFTSLLPPPSNTYMSYILEKSLDPNWQVPKEYQEAHFYRRTEAPLQCDWNTAFDAFYCLTFHHNPMYKTQCWL